MDAPAADPHWYRDAIVYEVRVRSFVDSDGDGIGDLRGLTSRLDYIERLGATAVWLLPFYGSPLRDDGYDISDYLAVHPDCGTLDDFRQFVSEAHRRGLRVVTELVLNHTSDQHPWFQRARRAPAGSRERDWYVWSGSPERYAGVRVIFQDFEPSNWTFDQVAGAWYWHRFFRTQPDLNFDSPDVRAAMLDVVDFWLDLGVDGLRLDAVTYLFEREGTSCDNLPETHAFLRELRRHVDRRFPGRMLLAEANLWPEEAVTYFGEGQECHLAFHFPLMPRLYLALATGDRSPITRILERTPELPPGAQWALFLRNHDELTLEMVSPEERELMWRVFAPDPRAILNLGLRRRLAPLWGGGGRRRIELLSLLLLTLPGTPFLYYGDEIGMGDDLSLPDRYGVRTPMQWTPGANAGFSAADPARLALPVVTEPPYYPETCNVAAQEAAADSLLAWTRRALAVRRRHARLFGRGSLTMLTPADPAVLAFVREHEGARALVVANLSGQNRAADLDLAPWAGLVPVDLWGGERFPAIDPGTCRFTLGPYQAPWFLLDGFPSATS